VGVGEDARRIPGVPPPGEALLQLAVLRRAQDALARRGRGRDDEDRGQQGSREENASGSAHAGAPFREVPEPTTVGAVARVAERPWRDVGYYWVTVMSRLITVTLLALLVSSPAYAYLDPGTGSVLIQGLVAALAVASAAVAAFWTRLRQLFSGRRKPADPEHPDAPPS
jgi:hypothetical protein